MVFAVPPQSVESLQRNADVIVVARVAKIDRIEKRLDTAYADTHFTLSLEITASDKGNATVGTTMLARTYQPSERPAGWAGPQGQNTIPPEGTIVRAYLRQATEAKPDAKREGTSGATTRPAVYELLLPNGIEVITPATRPADK